MKKNIYNLVEPYTICSEARINATIRSVEHVVKNIINGDSKVHTKVQGSNRDEIEKIRNNFLVLKI